MAISREEKLISEADNKDSISRKNLNELKKIRSLLFLIKYKDSLPLIQSPKQSYLKSLCQAMLLGFGFTHSAKGNGLFIDPYHRAAELFNEDKEDLSDIGIHRKAMLATSAIEMMKPYGRLPVSHPEFAREFIEAKPPNIDSIFGKQPTKLNNKQIAARKYPLIVAEEPDYDRELLGHAGLITNKDAQLWGYANRKISSEAFINKFKMLFYEMNPDVPPEKFNKILKSISYRPSTKESGFIKKEILEILNVKHAHKSQSFYLKMFSKIIAPLTTEYKIDSISAEQQKLSFSRLAYILQNAVKNIDQFELFLTYLEFAFDEIMFLLSLSLPYSRDNIHSLLENYIKEQYRLEDAPNGVLIGGSGMEVLTALCMTAMKEFDENNPSGEKHVFIQKGSYFEIPLFIEALSNREIWQDEDCCIVFGKNKTSQIKSYNDQLVDLIICSPQNNVSMDSEGFKSADLQKLIDKQLELREQSDKKLIVIIDTTMCALNDIYLARLLWYYQSEILSGRLAILTGHSLNKYFHMGLDKVPAGISGLFFNKKQYPVLHEYSKSKWLSDFLENDPTPQVMTHLIKYASDDISKYYSHIMKSSRFIHKNIVPCALFSQSSDKFVSIDYPYTLDDYHNNWGFVVVRMNDAADFELRNYIELAIRHLLAESEIRNRQGFGFSTTSQMQVSNNATAIRIGIGMESQAHLTAVFENLFDCISELNKIMRSHEEVDHYKLKKDIHNLTERYIEIARKNRLSEKHDLSIEVSSDQELKLSDSLPRYHLRSTDKLASRKLYSYDKFSQNGFFQSSKSPSILDSISDEPQRKKHCHRR